MARTVASKMKYPLHGQVSNALKSRQIYWACSSLCVYARTLHLCVRSLSAAAGRLMNEYITAGISQLPSARTAAGCTLPPLFASGWLKNIPRFGEFPELNAEIHVAN